MEVKDCFVIMPFSTSPSRSENEWTEIFGSFFFIVNLPSIRTSLGVEFLSPVKV